MSQQSIVYPDIDFEVIPNAIHQTSDGGYLIVSNFYTYIGPIMPHHNGNVSLDLIKTDQHGNFLWGKKNVLTDSGIVGSSFLDQNDNLYFYSSDYNWIVCGIAGYKADKFRMHKFDANGDEVFNISMITDCDERLLHVIQVQNGWILNSWVKQLGNSSWLSNKTFVDVNGNKVWSQVEPRNYGRIMVPIGNTIHVPFSLSGTMMINSYNLQGQPTGSLSTTISSGLLSGAIATSDQHIVTLSNDKIAKIEPTTGMLVWEKTFSSSCRRIIERNDGHFYLYKQNPITNLLEINLLSPLGDSLSTDAYGEPHGNRSGDIILASNGIDYAGTGSIGCCLNDTIYGPGNAAFFTNGITTSNDDLSTIGSRVFPNPAQQQITILLDEYSGKLMRFDLYDLSGKHLYSATISQKQTTFDLAEHLKGYFIYNIKDGNRIATGKLVLY